MEHPTGTVTFLFTDIEGSTKFAQGHPDKWETLRERHHAILQSAIEAHNGHVFQIIGDAFCASFHTAKNGLSAALESQQKLQTENWEDTPIKVRMGIHTGEAEKHGNDYRGYLTLARVQRVMSTAYGGQVLLSNASAELIHNELPDGITLRDMKEHRFKSLLNPEHLWQIVAPDMRQDFPPLQSLNEIPNNLPVQLTSFVGRENEIAKLKQELTEHRLVTLTGSGGTGKTRLSLQVAADLLDHFDHGVWFIELAPLSDPDLIPQTILSAIGVSEQPNKMPLEILKEYLNGKKSLIVLDNCEHLVTASAKVANDLLNAALRLKILASSREALGIKGELSYPIPSLSLPDVKHLPTIDQLSQYESVRLFIDRAILVAPHFVVDKDNAPFITQICYRLDGIPLAIELAAARIKMLSVEQISKRLDDRFRLLTGGSRTALPRQQTLRALIDWSYDILSENERLLLQRLSVFAGSWTLEAAEEVCIGQDDIFSYDVLDLLTQLVNKSLVIVMEGSQSGETRYRMLETIRQYAREKHLESGGSEGIRDKHLAYFVKLVEQAEPELYRSNQVFWFHKLEDEVDNIRMTIERAVTANVKSGLQISILWRFWVSHGYYRELSEWLARLLEHYDIVDALRVQALVIHAYCLFILGNFPEAIRLAGQSLQMARTLSNQKIEAFSLSFLGVLTLGQGNMREGISLLEQSLNIYHILGDKIGQAEVLQQLANNNNNTEHAIDCARESLNINRELGNLFGIPQSLTTLAQLAIRKGDFSSPAPLLEEAIAVSRQIGNQTSEAWALHAFGSLAYWQGDYRVANAYFEEEVILSEKIGDRFQNLWAHAQMAYIVLRQGDVQRACEMFATNIRDTQKADMLIGTVYIIEGLASLKVNIGQVNRATQLFAWSDAMREKIGDHRPPVEQASIDKDLAVIHSKIDDTEYTNFIVVGRDMTTEQAIALALAESS